jgi:signal transduction histidine kinase
VTAAAVIAAGAAAFTVATGMPAATVRATLAGAAVAFVIAVAAASYAGTAAARKVRHRITAVQTDAAEAEAHLRQMVRDLQGGHRPRALTPAPAHTAYSDPFRRLELDLNQLQYIAEQAVIRAAALMPVGLDQRVEIFVNLARRMQSLVYRQIQLLDALEFKVEDPDLLNDLYRLDHLATRTLRAAENVGVLGGAASRRQWSRQVSMNEVLRAGISEVEQYARVKAVPPVEGQLKGAAIGDVIHLVAELIENATRFSPPQHPVLLRAQRVAAGLAVEVEDRGLGMPPGDRQRMNLVLADPSRINVTELLRDGRIGLFVVSTLARRHGIKVQLQNNIYGGTQAIAVLPSALLATDDEDSSPAPGQLGAQAETRRPEADLAGAVAPAAPGTLPPPAASRPSLPADTPRPEPANGTPAVPAAPAGQRPALPRRTPRENLVPELRNSPVTRHSAEAAEPTANLMKMFQDGGRSAEDEPGTPRSDGATN